MNPIEPGLLQISRWIIGMMWLLLSCGLCTSLEQTPPPYFALFGWLFSGMLFLYLRWGWVQRRLKGWFFPLLVIALALEPILAQWIETFLRLVSGFPTVPDPAILYIWLLLPLLLVSAQYNLRMMLFFNVATALLPIILNMPFAILQLPGTDAVVENSIVRFILFTITGFMVVRITSAQRQTRLGLARQNQQLQHYALTLERLAVSRERNRMARELHDTLAHTLSAVSVQLQAIEAVWEADANAAHRMLNQTQELARNGLHEARRALHALRASPLEDLGLVLALQHLAQSTADRAGLQIELHLPDQSIQVRPEIEQGIYRIAEEAMNNIVRHANAHHMRVDLRQRVDGLELIIRDDGIGFHLETLPNGHYGIVGMRERAALIGGELDLQSAPGAGTTVIFKVKEQL